MRVCFTCCSRDDSLRVKVSEEQAVDQGGFSKSRFTFWQHKKMKQSSCCQHQYTNIKQLLKMTKAQTGSGWCFWYRVHFQRREQKEILTVLQETRDLPVTHSGPRTTRKHTILNLTSALIFPRTTSGGWLNNPGASGRSASVHNQSAAVRCYESRRRLLGSFTLTNMSSENQEPGYPVLARLHDVHMRIFWRNVETDFIWMSLLVSSD